MTRRLVLIAALLLLLAAALAWWLERRALQPDPLTPTLTGEVEYCLTCHADLPQISASHPVETFGCVLCHGGERLALDADLAHSSLRGGDNPSDLAVVEASCGGGDCHGGDPAAQRDHIQRVMTSIQVNYTGAVTSLRFTFGAQPDLTPVLGTFASVDASLPSQTGILSLGLFDPAAETHPMLQAFGQNCLTCHINAQPAEGEAYRRYTGCAACHTPAALEDVPLGEGEDGRNPGGVHRLTTAIPYTQCNTCHNRGNYDLRSMTFVERQDEAVTRLEDYYQPIAQFTLCEYTLDCVDCHTRVEAMGDGDIHAVKSDIQYVRCSTCHGTPDELPLSMTLGDADDLAIHLAFLNPVVDLQVGDTILVTSEGEPLWNTRLLPDGGYELVGKATRQVFRFEPVMGSACTQEGSDQSSAYCHTCHAVKR
jgi:hypothetical protein